MSRFYKVKTGECDGQSEFRYIDLSKVVEVMHYPTEETKCGIMLSGTNWHLTVWLPTSAMVAIIDSYDNNKGVQP